MASYESPTEYIQHHLTFMVEQVGSTSFWAVNADTVVTSLILGFIGLGFMWWVTRKATAGVPSKTQAFVELCIQFVNDQVKGIYHGNSLWVAPIALTVFVWVVLMNAMDILPVDILSSALGAVGLHYWRVVPTADINTTFALALTVFALMVDLRRQGEGLRRLDEGAVRRAVRQTSGVVDLQFPVPSRRIHQQAAVAQPAAVRQHLRGRDHLPVARHVGRERTVGAPSSAACSISAGRSSTS